MIFLKGLIFILISMVSLSTIVWILYMSLRIDSSHPANTWRLYSMWNSKVFRSWKNVSLINDLERLRGCRRTTDFKTQPIVIAGGPSLQSFDMSPGPITCPAVRCEFRLANQKTKLSEVDFFGVYHSRMDEVAKFKVCSNQQFFYYSWEAWTPGKLKSFPSHWDIVLRPSSRSDLIISYFEHDLFAKPENKTATALVSAFVSNCDFVFSKRNKVIVELYRELGKLGHSMDIFGKCFGDMSKKEPIVFGEPSTVNRTRNTHDRNMNKLTLMKRYKFNLAFENTNEDGYISEKLWQAYEAGTIPVVLWTRNMEKYLPTKDSALMVSDNTNIADLAERIVYLSQHPEEYDKMNLWKTNRNLIQESHWNYRYIRNHWFPCRVCVRMADTLDPQFDISPPKDGIKRIKVRKVMDYYYKEINLPNTIKELKEIIKSLWGSNKKITRMYPARIKTFEDQLMNDAYALVTDEHIRNLPHGFQLEFIQEW